MSPVETFIKNEHSGRIWRWLVNFWTVVYFLAAMYDFVHKGEYEFLIAPMSAVYIACLAIYSAEKEFERWQFYFMGRHPGELYVIAWTVLAFGMFGMSWVTKGEYHLEPDIFSTYVVVLGILAITRKSKLIFEEKCRK